MIAAGEYDELSMLRSERLRLQAENEQLQVDRRALAAEIETRRAQRRAYPDEVTPAVHEVLMKMNFMTGPIAHCLRAGGENIPHKIEEEQAFVLHWLIKLALDYPDDWRDRAGKRIEEIRDRVVGEVSPATSGESSDGE